ncbi:CDAN1-interacting nuclease 1 like protein, partial [Aduncisulcus paluster]
MIKTISRHMESHHGSTSKHNVKFTFPSEVLLEPSIPIIAVIRAQQGYDVRKKLLLHDHKIIHARSQKFVSFSRIPSHIFLSPSLIRTISPPFRDYIQIFQRLDSISHHTPSRSIFEEETGKDEEEGDIPSLNALLESDTPLFNREALERETFPLLSALPTAPSTEKAADMWLKDDRKAKKESLSMTFPTPPSNACSFAIDCSGQLGSASFWGGSGCSIGAEYEYILQQQLLQYKTHFITEEMLYVCGGVTGVPDILLDVPIVVKGHLVNWIDSKAIFGSISYHRKQYVRQYSRFTEKNGKGCVVYWYGYEQGCESLFDDVIVLSHLPLSDEGEICVIEERERAVVGKDHRDQAEIMKDLHRSGGTDYEELSGGSDALVENDDTD